MKARTLLLAITPFFFGDVFLAVRLHDANQTIGELDTKLGIALARGRAAEQALAMKDVDTKAELIAADEKVRNDLNNSDTEDLKKVVEQSRGTLDGIEVRDAVGIAVATSGKLDESGQSYVAKRKLIYFGREIGAVVVSKKLD